MTAVVASLAHRGKDGSLWLVIAVIVGTVIRALPVLGSPFPLHDGGLFVVMADEIRSASFGLPITTDYNGLKAPFAYPPLGLYAVAGLSSVAPATELLRWLPLLYSALAIVGTYLVVRGITDGLHGGVSALIFALTPAAFDWLIVGGGVTRGLGFMLSLFAVAAAVRAARPLSMKWSLIAGSLMGATVLAHLEAAAFAAASAAVLCVGVAGIRKTLVALAIGALVAGIVSAPWWMTVLSRHGIEVFAGAAGSRQAWVTALQRLMELRLTGGSFLLLDVPLILALIGSAICLGQRRWLFPAWGLVVLVTPAAGSYYLTPVLAGLGATAVHAVRGVASPGTFRLSAAVAIAAGLVNVLLVPNGIGAQLSAIPSSDRTAIAVLERSDDPVAVFTRRPWWGEGPGEWLPALSGRRNPALAQGTEWLGAAEWHNARKRHEALQQCFSAGCIAEWMEVEQTRTLFVSAVAEVPVEDFLQDHRFELVNMIGNSAILELDGD